MLDITVKLANGKTIECHGRLEGSVTRCDLRPLVEALGLSVDTSLLKTEDLLIVRKG